MNSKLKLLLKIDLRSGYHQLNQKKVDIPEPAFSNTYGHFEFYSFLLALQMTRWLSWTLLIEFLETMLFFVIVFIDDIFIYSKSDGDHVNHLRIVFHVLKDSQFFVKYSKYKFGLKLVALLGNFFSSEGVKIDPRKMETVNGWPNIYVLLSLEASWYRHGTIGALLSDFPPSHHH